MFYFRTAGSCTKGDQEIQTRNDWVGSTNAASVLCCQPVLLCFFRFFPGSGLSDAPRQCEVQDADAPLHSADTALDDNTRSNDSCDGDGASAPEEAKDAAPSEGHTGGNIDDAGQHGQERDEDVDATRARWKAMLAKRGSSTSGGVAGP